MVVRCDMVAVTAKHERKRHHRPQEVSRYNEEGREEMVVRWWMVLWRATLSKSADGRHHLGRGVARRVRLRDHPHADAHAQKQSRGPHPWAANDGQFLAFFLLR